MYPRVRIHSVWVENDNARVQAPSHRNVQIPDGVFCFLKVGDTVFAEKYCMPKIRAHLEFYN